MTKVIERGVRDVVFLLAADKISLGGDARLRMGAVGEGCVRMKQRLAIRHRHVLASCSRTGLQHLPHFAAAIEIINIIQILHI